MSIRFVRRAVRRSVRRMAYRIAIAAVSLSCLLGGVAFVRNAAEEAYAKPAKLLKAAGLTRYASRVVRQGETLWSIAKELCPDGLDVRDYIAAVERLNRISGDYIKEGDVICLFVSE